MKYAVYALVMAAALTSNANAWNLWESNPDLMLNHDLWPDKNPDWAQGFTGGHTPDDADFKDGLLAGIYGCKEDPLYPAEYVCQVLAGGDYLRLRTKTAFTVKERKPAMQAVAARTGLSKCYAAQTAYDPDTMLRSVRQVCVEDGVIREYRIDLVIEGGWNT